MRGLIDKIKAQTKGKAAGPALFLTSLWLGCLIHWMLPDYGVFMLHAATFVSMAAGCVVGAILTGKAWDL